MLVGYRLAVYLERVSHTADDKHTIACRNTTLPRNYKKQNWNQFLLVVKATALKQQISKCYSQILSTQKHATTCLLYTSDAADE